MASNKTIEESPFKTWIQKRGRKKKEKKGKPNMITCKNLVNIINISNLNVYFYSEVWATSTWFLYQSLLQHNIEAHRLDKN